MSRRRRVFVAINLPENTKKELANFQTKWPELPVTWTRPNNLHLTLVFLGHVSDAELPKILRIIEDAAPRHSSFSTGLTKICYGPPQKNPPRMVWVEGKKSDALENLQKDLEKSLGVRETRPYSPHLTLGRIRQMEFRQIEPEERPEIKEDISINFEVKSVELMESELKRGGAEYATLKSFPLKQ